MAGATNSLNFTLVDEELIPGLVESDLRFSTRFLSSVAQKSAKYCSFVRKIFSKKEKSLKSESPHLFSRESCFWIHI